MYYCTFVFFLVGNILASPFFAVPFVALPHMLLFPLIVSFLSLCQDISIYNILFSDI